MNCILKAYFLDGIQICSDGGSWNFLRTRSTRRTGTWNHVRVTGNNSYLSLDMVPDLAYVFGGSYKLELDQLSIEDIMSKLLLSPTAYVSYN